MKLSRYISFYTLILPFFLFSCETVIELDLPGHKPQLVINSVISPDSLFTVDISASQSPLVNGSYEQLTDATVQVYQSGQLLYNLNHVGSGIYKADYKPQALQYYELRVSSPGLSDVKAQNFIPAAPLLTDLRTSKVLYTADYGATRTLLFTLDEAASQENYYLIQAYTPDTSYVDRTPYKRTVSLNFVSPIEAEFTMEARYFFSDKLINGKQTRFTLSIDDVPNRTIYLHVAQISKEYYEYARTLNKQAAGDDFGKTPTPVANNIQGGMGLFGGYNAAKIAIRP
jgi:hypothetical protein